MASLFHPFPNICRWKIASDTEKFVCGKAVREFFCNSKKMRFHLFRACRLCRQAKQSTGLFSPKRSTSRVSPLRRRTETVPRPVPVFRSAYSPKTVHWTIFGETLDLQGLAPPCEPSNGSQGMRSVIVCESFLTVRACPQGEAIGITTGFG